MKNFIYYLFVIVLYCYAQLVISKPIPSEKLFTSPDTVSYKLNPNSTQIASYINNKDLGQSVLELIDINLKSAQEIIGFEWKNGSRLIDYYWIDNDTLFVEYKDGNHNQRTGFIELNFTKEGKIKPKLHRIRARGYIVDPLKNEENKVMFIKNTGDDYDDIRLYTTNTQNLLENDLKREDEFKNTLSDAFVYVTDSNNQIRISATYDGEKYFYWWYLDEKTDDWVEFGKINNLDFDFTPVGFIEEGKIAVITNKSTDLNSLFEYDVKTKKLGKLLYQHSKYDLVNAEVNQKDNTLVYVQYFDHGQLVTQYFSKEDSKISTLLAKAFPNKQSAVVSGSSFSRYKILVVFGSNDPGKFYLFDSKTKSAKLLEAMYKNIDEYDLARSEVLVVNTAKNKKIEAILTRPKTLNNGVLLVMPHGGPVGVRDYDYFNPEVQYFVSRGFTVLNVNFSGSEGFGKKFKNSGRGQFGKRIEEDISATVNEIKKKYSFSKMCSMGSSYGGYSAMMLAIYNPKDYDCVIAKYGIYDLSLLFNESNIQRQVEHIKGIVAVVGEYDESLKKYSPFYLADKVKAPVLLIAGKSDKTASFEQTNRMKYRLNQLGSDYETMFYEGVGHGHRTWRGDKHELAVVFDFLERKLNLQKPKGKEYQKILSEEYMTLSDSYSFKDFVIDDYKKALSLNIKAANLGNPRGMFNLGSFYHQGKEVNKDLGKAISWYKKSSKAGYSDASFRLGTLYRNGKEVTIDLKQSAKYYDIALMQGNKKAKLEVNSRTCFKKEPNYNIDLCIEALQDGYKDRDNRDRVFVILSDFLWDHVGSIENLKSLKAYLQKNYKINITTNIKASIDDYGLLKKSYKTRSKVEVRQKTQQIVMKKGLKFGIRYEIKPTIDLENQRPKTLVKVRWTFPQMKDPKTKNSRTSYQHITRAEMYGRKYYRTNYNWYTLDYDWEMNPGEWKVEIFALDGSLLAQKSFNLLVAPVENPGN